MKAWCVAVVVGLWIYSVFLWARWKTEVRARGAHPAGSAGRGWVTMYLKLSGLPVLAWVVLMM